MVSPDFPDFRISPDFPDFRGFPDFQISQNSQKIRDEGRLEGQETGKKQTGFIQEKCVYWAVLFKEERHDFALIRCSSFIYGHKPLRKE